MREHDGDDRADHLARILVLTSENMLLQPIACHSISNNEEDEDEENARNVSG